MQMCYPENSHIVLAQLHMLESCDQAGRIETQQVQGFGTRVQGAGRLKPNSYTSHRIRAWDPHGALGIPHHHNSHSLGYRPMKSQSTVFVLSRSLKRHDNLVGLSLNGDVLPSGSENNYTKP